MTAKTKNTRARATTAGKRIKLTYQGLYDTYGPQHWWPGDCPFEVCIGAILTQSTSWTNVEKAIGNMKDARILSIKGIRRVNSRKLAGLIRPSLYYNVKARKLKEFIRFLDEQYASDVNNMRKTEMAELRKQLLAVWGLGPETVDSMLLYAISKPSFVVDAYTRRIFSRLGLSHPHSTYDELKSMFEASLPKDVRLYNEYHALIVRHGKTVCKTKPKCLECCLKKACANRIR